MLRLNIISDSLKKDIKLKMVYRLLKNFYGLLIISVLTAATALLAGKFMLQNMFISTVHETTILTRSTENYSNQVSAINTKIQAIDSIQKSHITWSGLFAYIDSLADSNLSFNRISINKSKNILEATGSAKNREDILKLKESLEKKEIFADVEFPISNFLKKENINFEFTLTIAEYDFNRL